MRINKQVFFLIAVFILTAWSASLPKLFLIGDSISIQYGPYLEKYLRGFASYERKQDDGSANKNLDYPTGANGGDSKMVLNYLRHKLDEPGFKPDYLLLNCGLHDIKRNTVTREIQVPEEEYRENIETIIQLLKKRHIQMIWMRTTAVVDSIHNAKSSSFHRFATDVETYNQIADEVCAKNKIPVIDLHSFTKQLGEEQFTDHVHYKEPARALQAAFIAGAVRTILNTESKSKEKHNTRM
ncbi:MAG TPA: lipase [Prolixibacteraceae bacterium]|nr:lipase [Prolixibacteraceae bacterium]HCR89850.1 lipase [Prolixibacteraceae bacterium]HCU63508.1 lipase [Prolixibacteraceae bacterium]